MSCMFQMSCCRAAINYADYYYVEALLHYTRLSIG